MRSFHAAVLVLVLVVLSSAQIAPQSTASPQQPATNTQQPTPAGEPANNSAGVIFGFRDGPAEAKWEQQFLAVPDAKLAEEHLRILTSAPHIASSPEDRKTA